MAGIWALLRTFVDVHGGQIRLADINRRIPYAVQEKPDCRTRNNRPVNLCGVGNKLSFYATV